VTFFTAVEASTKLTWLGALAREMAFFATVAASTRSSVGDTVDITVGSSEIVVEATDSVTTEVICGGSVAVPI